ncbi:MAG: Uma2 family endonuclease [Chloroflexi bacterium]|nr:Uma2 family endonuclease [Chloroflexota bacterium]
MATSLRWTTADLEGFPDPLDDTRYEIIDGELYVSRQPDLGHQHVCIQVSTALQSWSTVTGRGFAYQAPGVIFAEDDNVAPDVVWISRERLRTALKEDGMLHEAPELIVEVLSPGAANETRDRDAKLKLYSRRSVEEYWIVDWQNRQVEVYRRDGPALRLVTTLDEHGHLESPLLPGFSVLVGKLFFPEEI